MKVIHKYLVHIAPIQSISMPSINQPLCVQEQNGLPVLWTEVDPTQKSISQMIYVFGTGQAHPNEIPMEYIDTLQLGPLVWHFYKGL